MTPRPSAPSRPSVSPTDTSSIASSGDLQRIIEAVNAATVEVRRPTTTVGDPARRTEELAPREAQIMALIAAGLSNREIALSLDLSVNSVKTYIRSAYRKCQVTSRSRAVRYWLELTGPSPADAAETPGGGDAGVPSRTVTLSDAQAERVADAETAARVRRAEGAPPTRPRVRPLLLRQLGTELDRHGWARRDLPSAARDQVLELMEAAHLLSVDLGDLVRVETVYDPRGRVLVRLSVPPRPERVGA
ncbi:LuxR C-terminal-related transcriptional regulator [Nocardioides sp. C4-1]|uniref:helix-turn-helix transcriptional regulator n=1 Tax=Nocardioides sp. C4-1 TaxID=3151851 RepID=UPI003262D754